MGYDRGDSFPFDFGPSGISFGSENRKENSHHDHIPFTVKGNGNLFFSVHKKKSTESVSTRDGNLSLTRSGTNFCYPGELLQFARIYSHGYCSGQVNNPHVIVSIYHDCKD